MEKKEKKETVCVRVTKDTHKKAKDHVGDKIKIGAFFDEAGLEKIQKEKSKTK